MTKLLLFDVDGTLCHSGKEIEDRFIKLFEGLAKDYIATYFNLDKYDDISFLETKYSNMAVTMI